MTALSDFFQALGKYDFLQSALITAVMVGIMSGIIGSFIILRGMSLMGDAISHSVLPGVAVAYNWSIYFWRTSRNVNRLCGFSQ